MGDSCASRATSSSGNRTVLSPLNTSSGTVFARSN